MIVWLTGRPACGKTTLARKIREHRPACLLLDSDEIRDAIGAHGYGPDDREAFYRALGQLALVFERQGFVVLVAATAARRAYRDAVRGAAERFVEIYVRTPQAVCEARDPKGLYRRAHEGGAPELPGVGAEYEPPVNPEITAEGGDDEVALRSVLLVL